MARFLAVMGFVMMAGATILKGMAVYIGTAEGKQIPAELHQEMWMDVIGLNVFSITLFVAAIATKYVFKREPKTP